jgi:small neutral amino acid transporter SnatA (MarC family)
MDPTIEDSSRIYAGSCEKLIALVFTALFAIVDPLGGTPFFLALPRERKAKSIVTAHCHYQFFLAGWLASRWDLRSRLFGISLPMIQRRRRHDRYG